MHRRPAEGPAASAPRPCRRRQLTLLSVTAGLLAACAGGQSVVAVPPPAPSGAGRDACVRLAAALPSSLGPRFGRRQVTPASPFTAAWGRPPIVLACGVDGLPRAYRPASELEMVNDVGWYAEDLGEAARFTTVTRTPHVVLTVPKTAGQAFDALASLADPVRSTTRPTTP